MWYWKYWDKMEFQKIDICALQPHLNILMSINLTQINFPCWKILSKKACLLNHWVKKESMNRTGLNTPKMTKYDKYDVCKIIYLDLCNINLIFLLIEYLLLQIFLLCKMIFFFFFIIIIFKKIANWMIQDHMKRKINMSIAPGIPKYIPSWVKAYCPYLMISVVDSMESMYFSIPFAHFCELNPVDWHNWPTSSISSEDWTFSCVVSVFTCCRTTTPI